MSWSSRTGSSGDLFHGKLPILETNEIIGTSTVDTKVQPEPIRDDPMSQAMLHVLESVIGTCTGPVAWGIVIEWLRTNEVELFRGVTGVTLIVPEYWLEATEHIMNGLDCTSI